MKKPFYLWLTIVALLTAQCAYYWPRLPNIVAQHFDAQGRPNGFAPKVMTYQFIVGLMALMFAIWFLFPKLLRRIPMKFMNIPNKKYWDTPEHRGRGLDMLEEQMNWFGVGVSALLLFTFHLMLHANLKEGLRLEPVTMWIALAGFFVFVMAWFVIFLRRFNSPSRER